LSFMWTRAAYCPGGYFFLDPNKGPLLVCSDDLSQFEALLWRRFPDFYSDVHFGFFSCPPPYRPFKAPPALECRSNAPLPLITSMASLCASSFRISGTVPSGASFLSRTSPPLLPLGGMCASRFHDSAFGYEATPVSCQLRLAPLFPAPYSPGDLPRILPNERWL